MWVSVGLRVILVGWVCFIKGEETVEEDGRPATTGCLEAQVLDGRRKEDRTSRREMEPRVEAEKVESKEANRKEESSSGSPS